MNKVLPPLHAQMQFPDLNLEDRERMATVHAPKIAMSPMKIYVLMCIYRGYGGWESNPSAVRARNELIDSQLLTYNNVTRKGMDYIEKLLEVQP